LIRREEGGEVSNYLHGLPERATIAVRGPFEECPIPQDVKNVIFLAGGTGIAPALQVARLLKERNELKVHILWANRKREDCVGGKEDRSSRKAGVWSWFRRAPTASGETPTLGRDAKGTTVQLLDELKEQARSGHLLVDCFVDEEGTSIKPGTVSKLLQGPWEGKSVVLISGPDGFMEYWAGRKDSSVGYKAQGRLGGQLAKLDTKGWTVLRI
jgi:hypothetical protein